MEPSCAEDRMPRQPIVSCLTAGSAFRFRSALVLIALLASAPGRARAQGAPAPTQNATAGAAVFGEKGCTKCHAVSGQGAGTLGPNLRVTSHERRFEDLAASLWNHLPQMSERMAATGIDRPRLSPREAGDLIAFLYTLDYFDAPGDSANGRALFSSKGCIFCHQIGGTGGVVGPDLDHVGARGAPIEIATAMWNHGPAMSEEARSRGIPRPRLDGTELADLIAYLEAVAHGTQDQAMHLLPGRADRGRELLAEKGCVDCHGEPGAGGRLAPDLARAGRAGNLIDFVAAMWNKAPAMLVAIERQGGELPRLESGEVADIVAYFYSVQYFVGSGDQSGGRRLLERKGCLDCHRAEKAGVLEDRSSVQVPAAVVAALWNHVTAAEESIAESSWPLFDGAEMADLMAYFRTGIP